MSIQYAGGTRVETDFFGDTIANLKAAINTNLVTAGWTSVVSGGGFLLSSGITPQALQCKVDLQDNGTAVTIRFQDTTATKLGFLHTTTPAANKRYRIIANQYQFFLFVQNVSTVSSGAIMGGVPWVPAFLQAGTTTAIWSVGDSGGQNTFRNSLVPNSSSSSFILNANVCTGSGLGSVRLVGVQSSATNIGVAGLWFNNCALIVEPMLCWGTSNNAVPTIIGELWDASLVMQAYQLDLASTFDTHNWTTATDNNSAGTLFLVTP